MFLFRRKPTTWSRVLLLNNHDLLKVDLDPVEVPDENIKKWISEENELYRIIHDKIKRIPSVKDTDKYVELNIKTYLEGQNILNRLHKEFPTLFEHLLKYKNAQELEVENFSMMKSEQPAEFLRESYKNFEELIKENLGNKISHSTIKYLSGEAVADWLIRCPLDF
jgi:hypothetical protein